ncbi:MAG: hypothetical protein MR691_14845 [Clostridium sp.]|nr:hypothetical protein [Clostridium sp.]
MITVDKDGTTIRVTRGDATGGYNNKLAFKCPYIDMKTKEKKEMTIKLNDVISFVVYEKKGYTKKEILRKDYTLRQIGYRKETTTPELPLDEIVTKKFPLTNKPVTYWYDIVINNKYTVIGYDDKGPKKVVVYPEADEE